MANQKGEFEAHEFSIALVPYVASQEELIREKDIQQ
jgi:hypothetical protein